MDFDQAFQVFISWQSAVLCLGIYVITYAIRTIVEAAWPGSRTNKLWTELFLPLGPIATGVLIAIFATAFPWPVMAAGALKAALSSRMLYGSVCGLMSGWAYGRLRSWMRTANINIPGMPPGPDSIPAPPLVPVIVSPSAPSAPSIQQTVVVVSDPEPKVSQPVTLPDSLVVGDVISPPVVGPVAPFPVSPSVAPPPVPASLVVGDVTPPATVTPTEAKVN